MENKIKISKCVKEIVRDNRVLLINTANSRWIKLSKECYTIIISAQKNNLTRSELLSRLYDDEDKSYFSRMLDLMSEMYIIENENNTFLQREMIITLSLTNRCNLSCKHCCIDADSICESENMATESIYEVIDKILQCSPTTLVLTGGEPMIREDFFDIVKYIKSKYQNKLCLMTNGLLINQNNVQKLIPNFNSIDISIDGTDEESCSKTRGKGVFSKVIEVVKLLKTNNYENISLSMVKNNYTYFKIEDFNKLNERLGTRPIIRLLAPSGRAAENLDYLISNNNVSMTVIDEKNPKIGDRIDKKDVIESIISEKRNIINSSEQNLLAFSCSALQSRFYIGSDGYLYPCPGLAMEEFRVASIFQITNLNSYINDKEYLNSTGYKNFENILPYKFEPCKNCDVNLFCISCPLYVYLYKKFNFFKDYCGVRYPIFNSLVWR